MTEDHPSFNWSLGWPLKRGSTDINSVWEIQVASGILHVLYDSHHIHDLILSQRILSLDINSVCEIQAATRIDYILPNSHQIHNLILRVVLKERFHCGINSVCEIQAATGIANIWPNSHQIHIIFRVVLKEKFHCGINRVCEMLAATGILHILTSSHQIFITDHAKKLHRQVYPVFSYRHHLQTCENQQRWQTTAINVQFTMMALETVWHCYLHTKVRKRLSVTKQRCRGRCSNWQVMQLRCLGDYLWR